MPRCRNWRSVLHAFGARDYRCYGFACLFVGSHGSRSVRGEKSRRFGTVEIARGRTIPHVEHYEHHLGDICPIGRRAVCAHCCPVHIKPKQLGWRCGVAERKWKRNRNRKSKAKKTGTPPARRRQVCPLRLQAGAYLPVTRASCGR